MEIQSQHSNIQKLLVSACDKYYYEIKCVYQVPQLRRIVIIQY